MANSLNTITVDGVTYDASSYAASQKTNSTSNSSMGKDAFLQLLVTQMQYQDPLDPQDTNDMIFLTNFDDYELIAQEATCALKELIEKA